MLYNIIIKQQHQKGGTDFDVCTRKEIMTVVKNRKFRRKFLNRILAEEEL